MSEAQVRAAMSTFEAWSDPYVDAIVAAHTWSITNREYVLKVIDMGIVAPGRRQWSVYPKVVLYVDADRADDAVQFFAGYWADFETQINAMVAAAPPGREFIIDEFTAGF